MGNSWEQHKLEIYEKIANQQKWLEEYQKQTVELDKKMDTLIRQVDKITLTLKFWSGGISLITSLVVAWAKGFFTKN